MKDLLAGTAIGEFGLVEFLVSVIFSLAIGAIAMVLYRLYFDRSLDRNESLAQSFLIMAPAITAIFWAIQYSLPLSLGLLGALSFVRFRTPIKKAEDIGFILLVIALSLLSSIYRFVAACSLLLIIIATIGIRAFLKEGVVPFLRAGTRLTVFISTVSDNVEEIDGRVRSALKEAFPKLDQRHLVLHDIVPKDNGHTMRYAAYFKDAHETVLPKMITRLKAIETIEKSEVFVNNALV